MRVIDARTAAETLEDDSSLLILEGQGSTAYCYAESLARLDALGWVHLLDFGRAAMLADEGRGRLAMLRLIGDAPAGLLSTSETATGATLHYWPCGFGVTRANGGGRILAARWRHGSAALEFSPAFAPTGSGWAGAAAAACIAEAHTIVAGRALVLESDAAAEYRNPWA